ncbi:hypothetical protein [Nocardia beijingensis]|uniref:hypothetical protein n=1 Tax=Nocardia beijingensis TaxID=95162 RepID=UPI003D9EAC99
MTPARTAERIRVAAVGDLHMHAAVAGRFRPDFLHLSAAADVLSWGMLVDKFRPDRWDYLGAAICMVGVTVIMYAPRR